MSAIARNLLSFTFGCFTLGINFVFDSFTHLVILWYLIFYSCHPLLHFHICHFMLVVCIVLVSIYPTPLLYCFFCVCRIIFFFFFTSVSYPWCLYWLYLYAHSDCHFQMFSFVFIKSLFIYFSFHFPPIIISCVFIPCLLDSV